MILATRMTEKVESRNRVPIRLTKERWNHIIEHHPELKHFKEEVLLTISDPDHLYSLPKTVKSNFAAVKKFTNLRKAGLSELLIVHYRELSEHDGFILTAFPMSSKRLRRKFAKWLKLK